MPPDEFSNLEERCRRAQLELERRTRLRPRGGSASSSRNVHLDRAILNHSQASTLAIVNKVLDLPRELRDMIYTFLLNDGIEGHTINDQFRLNWDNFHGPWLSKDGMERWIAPHFFHLRFVGQQFSSEILESHATYYKMPGRRKLLIFGLYATGNYLNKNFLGVGKTMQEIAKDVNIGFVIDDEDIEWNGEKCISDLELLPENDKHGDNVELDTALSHVLNIPFTTYDTGDKPHPDSDRVKTRSIRFMIHYWIKPWKEMDRRTFLCLENLKATVYPLCFTCRMLHVQGFDVKIKYSEHEFKTSMVFDTRALEWTRDRWDSELLAFYEHSMRQHRQNRQDIEERYWIMEQIWNIFAEGFLKDKPKVENA